MRYPSRADQIEAFVSRPKTGGRHPAVVVVHDDLGLNDAIRSVTQVLAQAGFVAFAPNLASRGPGTLPPASGTQGAGTANRLRLPVVQTVNDVVAAFQFLQQDAGVDAARISAIGFGFGGYRVWKMAQQLPALHRAVVFYAVTPTEDAISTINTPVLGHYAQYDFVLTASVLKTQKQMGKKFTYYIYPADHGFFGGSSGGALDIAALAGVIDVPFVDADKKTQKAPVGTPDAAARLAFQRTLAFLKN